MTIYDKFCESSRAVLFATDIASRGLDFPSINWVIQVDCPEDVNTYIHRVGRTARMDFKGESLLVLIPSEEESMVNKLKEKKIPIEKISVNPQKLQSIQRKAETFLARDVTLKEEAQRAFKSYLKNYFMMKDKSVFDFSQLDLDSYAKSLGLMIAPRVRFIERKLASKQTPSNKAENKQKIEPVSSTQVEQDAEDSDSEQDQPLAKDGDVFKLDLPDEDEDLFEVKKVWRFDQDDQTESEPLPPLDSVNKRNKNKSQSKVSIAKRLLKKNIQVNSKITYDENDQPVIDHTKQQASIHVKDLDQVQSGIDIEIAKKIMQDEDKVDKKLYSDIIKEKHRIKKLKLKEMKREKKKGKEPSDVPVELDYDDEGEEDGYADEMTQKLIESLPDPDKFNLEENDDSDQDHFVPSPETKRKLPETESNQSSKKKSKKHKTTTKSSKLSSMEDMALKLLAN